MTETFGDLGRVRIAIEVGAHSPWVSRLLRSFGHEVIVANPSYGSVGILLSRGQ